MKTLDRYILKSFLIPFLATFLIILFVLVMQALWLVFDSLAGKGISVAIIAKFLWYTMLLVTPQALPIGVLLSSIMTLGSLSENYEFAATKSAGISLPRMVRPLVILMLGLSALNFFFLNNVYPYAMLKQLNMKLNIKKKQPALALVPGSFNTEIPDFQIKFDEKYGEDENLLKNVLIYDLSDRKGNNKIIRAKKGEITSNEGSPYLTLVLTDGNYFEEHKANGTSYKQRQRMPASYATFDEYTINIDISSFDDDDLEKDRHTRNYNMLSLQQLGDTIPKIAYAYKDFVNSKSNSFIKSIGANKLYQPHDSLITVKLAPKLEDNFTTTQYVNIISTAASKMDRTLSSNKDNKKQIKRKRKWLNLYEVEYYNRVAFSLSCLILFFIGAPLGSIIRKGGMGLPMVLAIAIYVTYFFSNTFGRNLAEESSITSILGSWLSVIIMFPIALTLTIRATQDKGLFNISNVIAPLVQKIKQLFSKEKTT